MARRLALTAALFAVSGVRAEAHLVTTGLGPLYDGIGHFVMSPEDWVTVLALGLLAGLRGAPAARLLLAVLPLAWIAGGMLPAPAEAPAIPLGGIVFLILGVLVAGDWPLPRWSVAALAAAVGSIHGWLNAIAIRRLSSETLVWFLSVGGSVFLIATLVSGIVVALRPGWMRIVVRVFGSWIAATGLLLLGWAFRATGR